MAKKPITTETEINEIETEVVETPTAPALISVEATLPGLSAYELTKRYGGAYKILDDGSIIKE
jgi:hypothetical protein